MSGKKCKIIYLGILNEVYILKNDLILKFLNYIFAYRIENLINITFNKIKLFLQKM